MTNHAPLLSRTLLYTALTRARLLVILVGQTKALSLAARNWRQAPRQTTLAGIIDGSIRLDWRRPGTDESRDHAPFEDLLESGEEW